MHNTHWVEALTSGEREKERHLQKEGCIQKRENGIESKANAIHSNDNVNRDSKNLQRTYIFCKNMKTILSFYKFWFYRYMHIHLFLLYFLSGWFSFFLQLHFYRESKYWQMCMIYSNIIYRNKIWQLQIILTPCCYN